MPDLLLVLLGAVAVCFTQALGLALIALIGENHRDAASYWYGLTGWPIWLGPYLLRERRRRRAYMASAKDREGEVDG